MLIEVSNVLRVVNPSPEFKRWCLKELVLSNPEYTKKIQMRFYVGDTPKTITLYEVKGKDIILPYGLLKSIPQDVLKDTAYEAYFSPIQRVNYDCDVPLYPYQENAVNGMLKARMGILQSAPGSGKTQMGIAIAARLGRKTLWLCHTHDLVNQSKTRAEQYMSSDLIGTITEGKINLGTGITFATVQTMVNIDLKQYKEYWDCIIVY